MDAKDVEVLTAQLPVEVELDGRATVIATLHCGAPRSGRSNTFNFGESNTRSFERALPKRDMTVPTGQSRTFAISWYERSSYSRNRIISRKSIGSSSIAARTCSASSLLT